MPEKKVYELMGYHKLTVVKIIFWACVICGVNKIYEAFYAHVINKYGADNAEYCFRLTILVLSILMTVLIAIRLFSYIKKNGESLLVLGVDEIGVLKLFFVRNIDFILAYFTIRLMLGMLHNQKIIYTIGVCLLNAVIIAILSVLLYKTVENTYVIRGFYVLVAIFFICITTGKIGYKVAKEVILSELLGNICYRVTFADICIRVVAAFMLFLSVIRLIKSRGIENCQVQGFKVNVNIVGDMLHKYGDIFIERTSYVWLYRDHDFLIWKLFSSIVYGFVCFNTKVWWLCALCGYVLGIVTATYVSNVYKLQQKHLEIYKLSGMEYSNYIKMQMFSTLFVIGDNIILITILSGTRTLTNLMILILLLPVLLLVGLFVNSLIYEKYPRKIYMYEIIVILIKMHIPIVNIIIWHRSYKNGRKNWREL